MSAFIDCQASRASSTEPSSSIVVVARIPVENHGLQDAAHDLAAARLGQHADEIQLADHRDRSELLADGVEYRLLQAPARLLAMFQQHERGDDFATCFVGAPDDAAFGH